jgi:hypothetical protein
MNVAPELQARSGGKIVMVRESVFVAQTSKSAVSRAHPPASFQQFVHFSKPAPAMTLRGVPIWKSAAQHTWKSAPRKGLGKNRFAPTL